MATAFTISSQNALEITVVMKSCGEGRTHANFSSQAEQPDNHDSTCRSWTVSIYLYEKDVFCKDRIGASQHSLLPTILINRSFLVNVHAC